MNLGFLAVSYSISVKFILLTFSNVSFSRAERVYNYCKSYNYTYYDIIIIYSAIVMVVFVSIVLIIVI